MKFECKGDVFIKAVQQVSRARSKVQTHNQLQDIHCEVNNHLLTLRATNLELFCEKSIPVKGITNGACLIQGETLLRIISTLASQDITLFCEVIEGVFTLTTIKGVIEIKTSTYEDFPKLPLQGDLIGTLPFSNIETLLREVSFCSAVTDIKPEISSVFIYTKNNLIYAVATDSFRLAEKTIPNEKDLDFSVLLPQKHTGEILQILQEEKDIHISKSQNIITLTGETVTLSIHTITGNFPDYQQLFPKEFLTSITINKEDLQKPLLLTTFFNETYSQVECFFTKNTCVLHSKNEKIGQVTQTLKTTQEGEDIEVKYNNKFFLEALPYIKGDIVVCHFTTANRPMVIKGKQDTTFTYLLMPLNR